jgi:hypothetical protein
MMDRAELRGFYVFAGAAGVFAGWADSVATSCSPRRKLTAPLHGSGCDAAGAALLGGRRGICVPLACWARTFCPLQADPLRSTNPSSHSCRELREHTVERC